MAVESRTVALVQATPVSTLSNARPWLYRSFFKRPIEVALVVMASPVVLPLILVLALLVMLRDGGNPFYTQKRIGMGGRSYRMWKLRSMVVDADKRLQDYLDSDPDIRREWELTQKLRSDPRVTVMGKVLRACSLDELPQLWNVVLGDMSLVGPRPMLPEQQALYAGNGYYRVRPGITGFWQVAGRNRTSFAARAWYDDRYERDVSFARDAGILVATVSVVMRRTGC